MVLQPTFQRKFVWDKKKSSRLIESILLKFPIPLIYLSEEYDETLIVIDGQQRLQAIFSFIDGKFPNNDRFKLTGVLEQFNNKTFKDLIGYNEKLMDSPLSCVIFEKESDPEVKFDVFERLNTGSVKLNAQEVRNCIYRGEYNEFLKELAQHKDFKYIMGLHEKPHDRMKDVEWVLRFAAFYNQTFEKYRTPLTFLNNEMLENKEFNEVKAQRLGKAFKNSVSIIKSIFGKKAFVRYLLGNEENASGNWEKTNKNVGLYEVLMYSFAEIPQSVVQPHLDAIREAFIVLMTRDDFKDAVTTRTGNRTMIVKRFRLWLNLLNEIIDVTKKEPRCFPFKLKQKLYEKNQTCQICNQNIIDIDDAEVDHIEQYWLGGKTSEENARLAHRYCNRSRSKND